MSQIETTTKAMTTKEAQEITNAIRANLSECRQLLLKAHDGKAFYALGYDTWEKYVEEKFSMSRPTSYRMIEAARVEANVGITPVRPTENTESSHILSQNETRTKPVPQSVLLQLAKLPDADTQRRAFEEIATTARGTAPVTEREAKMVVERHLRDVPPIVAEFEKPAPPEDDFHARITAPLAVKSVPVNTTPIATEPIEEEEEPDFEDFLQWTEIAFFIAKDRSARRYTRAQVASLSSCLEDFIHWLERTETA